MAKFLDSYHQLRQSIPVPALRLTNPEACEYCDYTHYSQNCHYCILCLSSQACSYCFLCNGKHLVDCLYCGMSELCYESIECLDCYRLTYSQDCTKCRDCHYCYQCFNCDSCFGCVALSNKKYCLFNRQLSQADYHQQLELVKQQSLDQILSQFTLLKQSTPVPQSMQRQTENCPYGDYITNCKDMYWGFNSYYVENSGYIYDSGMARDSWDTSFGGGSASGSNLQAMLSGTWQELCYEICGGSSNYHSAFLEYCSLCTNCYYSSGLSNCTDCFGCVGLKNKQSCVLNNQLTPDQYPHALAVIRSELGWPDPLP